MGGGIKRGSEELAGRKTVFKRTFVLYQRRRGGVCVCVCVCVCVGGGGVVSTRSHTWATYTPSSSSSGGGIYIDVMKRGNGWIQASIHLAILPALPRRHPLKLPPFLSSSSSSSQHAALLAAAAGQEMTCGHSVKCQPPPREREGERERERERERKRGREGRWFDASRLQPLAFFFFSYIKD